MSDYARMVEDFFRSVQNEIPNNQFNADVLVKTLKDNSFPWDSEGFQKAFETAKAQNLLQLYAVRTKEIQVTKEDIATIEVESVKFTQRVPEFYQSDANISKLIEWVGVNIGVVNVDSLSAAYLALRESGELEGPPATVKGTRPGFFKKDESDDLASAGVFQDTSRVNHNEEKKANPNRIVLDSAWMKRDMLNDVAATRKSKAERKASEEAAKIEANKIIALPLDTPDADLRKHNVATIKNLIQRRARASEQAASQNDKRRQ